MDERDPDEIEQLDDFWDRFVTGGTGLDGADPLSEAVVRTLHAGQPVPLGVSRRIWARAREARPVRVAAIGGGKRVGRGERGVGRAPGLVPGHVWPAFELVAAAMALLMVGAIASGGRFPGVGRLGPGTASAEAVMLPAAGPVATPGGTVDGLIVVNAPEFAGASGRYLGVLDPVTLLPVLGGDGLGPANLTGTVTFSADGSTRVDLLPAGDQVTEISVRDAISGNERKRITFPIALADGRLSADGTRLIGVAAGRDDLPQTWFVIPLTATAPDDLIHVEADVGAEPPSLLDDRFVIDADARYLYRLVTLGSRQDPAPRPVELAVADLQTGAEIARIDLPGVVSGPHADGTGPDPTEFDPRPALALSSDGTRLAIVHSDRAAVTTVAIAADGEPTRDGTIDLRAAQGVSWAYTGERANLWAVFGADNATLYVFGETLVPASWGAREAPIGIRRVDLERGEIVAEGLTDRRVLQATVTDGDVYVVVTTVDGMPPAAPPLEPGAHTLARLDPWTLEVDEERTYAVADIRIVFLSGAGSATE